MLRSMGRPPTRAPRILMGGIRTRNKRHEPRKQPIQARARASVEAILLSAAQIFEAEGYTATTTDRVAERAGVSVGTLYQYFPSKDALLVGLFEFHIREIAAAFDEIRARMARDAPLDEIVSEMVTRLFALHRASPRVHQILFEEAPIPEHLLARYADLAHALRAAWEAWLAPRVEDPEEVALLVVSAVEALVHRFTLFPVPQGHSAASLEAASAEMLVSYVQGAQKRRASTE